MQHRLATKSDYQNLESLWERSVRATHNFLSEPAILEIKEQLPLYFDAVNLLVWEDQDKLIGFSGTADDNLEILFLDVQYRGHGYGGQIIKFLIEKQGVKKVDVNEDNQAAFKFYQKMGFELTGRSEFDDQGRPFPILHLQLKK